MLIYKKRCGLSYDCGDTEGLANILSGLCEDRTIIKNIAENSTRVFCEKFTAEKVYKEMTEYLEGVIAVYNKKIKGYNT